MASNNNGNVNSLLGAALLGVAAGAAAVFFASEENRRNSKKKIQELKDQLNQQVGKIKSDADTAAKEGKKLLSQELQKAQTRLDASVVEEKPKRGKRKQTESK